MSNNVREFVKMPENAGEALEYFITLFPEHRVALMRMPKLELNTMYSELLSCVIASTEKMEVAYVEHLEFIKEQNMKHGTASLVAEVEHVQGAAHALNVGDREIGELLTKLTNETTRECILKEIVQKRLARK